MKHAAASLIIALFIAGLPLANLDVVHAASSARSKRQSKRSYSRARAQLRRDAPQRKAATRDAPSQSDQRAGKARRAMRRQGRNRQGILKIGEIADALKKNWKLTLALTPFVVTGALVLGKLAWNKVPRTGEAVFKKGVSAYLEPKYELHPEGYLIDRNDLPVVDFDFNKVVPLPPHIYGDGLTIVLTPDGWPVVQKHGIGAAAVLNKSLGHKVFIRDKDGYSSNDTVIDLDLGNGYGRVPASHTPADQGGEQVIKERSTTQIVGLYHADIMRAVAVAEKQFRDLTEGAQAVAGQQTGALPRYARSQQQAAAEMPGAAASASGADSGAVPAAAAPSSASQYDGRARQPAQPFQESYPAYPHERANPNYSPQQRAPGTYNIPRQYWGPAWGPRPIVPPPPGRGATGYEGTSPYSG